jgi:hypothetical protein
LYTAEDDPYYYILVNLNENFTKTQNPYSQEEQADFWKNVGKYESQHKYVLVKYTPITQESANWVVKSHKSNSIKKIRNAELN